MKDATTSSAHGFSLVEVVLALGVASFALVAMIGLLHVALETDADAGRDTAIAAMTTQVLGVLREVPFEALWYEDPAGSRSTAPSTAAPVDSHFYFTQEGVLVPTATANANNFQVLYECVVKKTPDERTRNATTGICNQLKVRLEFQWPAFVAGPRNRKTIHVSIARY